MECHTNTVLSGFQTQRDAAVKPLPYSNTVPKITTMALYTPFGVFMPMTYNSMGPCQGGSASLENIAIGALPFCTW